MARKMVGLLMVGLAAAVLLTAGCVERRLTIVTDPADAVVWLNDEEVGSTPVTVNFNWYGEYNVRIEKSGYEILNTHRGMERPLHDKFPFDFFAQVWPKRIVDEYTWNFDLQPYQQSSPQELIKEAEDMRQRATRQLGTITDEVLNEEKD